MSRSCRRLSLPTVAVLLAPWVLAACEEPVVLPDPPPRPIAWLEVQAAEFAQVRRVAGSLQAADTAVLSFEIPGKLRTVDVNLGDEVAAGQTLATLDPASFQLSTVSAQGRLDEANAALREAENEFRRQADLFERGWVSQAAFDNAEAGLSSAQSAVKVAQAQLALTREDLSDTILRAPYDGRITARLVEPSQQVGPGEAIYEIEGETGLEVAVSVPETLVGDLARDGIAAAAFPAVPGLTVDARIVEIGTRAEVANAFPVTLRLLEADARLRSGMTAEIDFTFGGGALTGYTGPVVAVPPTALVAGPGDQSAVFVFDRSAGVVRRRPVQVEEILNNQVFVSRGLEPREIIAVAGAEFLQNGQRVVLLDPSIRTYN